MINIITFRVISRAMSGNAISAMTSGRSKTGDEVLMAADRDGHCFVWNLALFRVSPLQVLNTFFNSLSEGNCI